MYIECEAHRDSDQLCKYFIGVISASFGNEILNIELSRMMIKCKDQVCLIASRCIY